MISELFCQAARLIPLRFSKRSAKEVGKTIGSGVGVGVGVTVADGVGLGSTFGEGAGVGVLAGIGFTFLIGTPWFHTNFFPDFTQVNFRPLEVDVIPTFLHA